MGSKKGIIERLREGPVVGDGSMLFTLEKRGYVNAGRWTPEAVLKYPEAVLQLHKEFVRAGADVVQTASFYSTDDRLRLRASGNVTQFTVRASFHSAHRNNTGCNVSACFVCIRICNQNHPFSRQKWDTYRFRQLFLSSSADDIGPISMCWLETWFNPRLVYR